MLDAARICTSGSSSTVRRAAPTGYGRLADLLYLHGSSANSSILAGRGQQVCVTVTHLDGLVCARSVFNHSMNYRSAVIFGVARLVADPDEKLLALRTITEHLVPGQWSYARQPSTKELAATSALALPLTEASVKIRACGPRTSRRTMRWRSGGRGAGDDWVRGTRTGRRAAAGHRHSAAHPQAGPVSRLGHWPYTHAEAIGCERE